MFRHPAWALGSYSSGPPAAGSAGTKAIGGFPRPLGPPCKYFPHLLNVHPMLMDGFQVEREGVLGEPVQHGLHGLARPRTVCV